MNRLCCRARFAGQLLSGESSQWSGRLTSPSNVKIVTLRVRSTLTFSRHGTRALAVRRMLTSGRRKGGRDMKVRTGSYGYTLFEVVAFAPLVALVVTAWFGLVVIVFKIWLLVWRWVMSPT